MPGYPNPGSTDNIEKSPFAAGLGCQTAAGLGSSTIYSPELIASLGTFKLCQSLLLWSESATPTLESQSDHWQAALSRIRGRAGGLAS